MLASLTTASVWPGASDAVFWLELELVFAELELVLSSGTAITGVLLATELGVELMIP